MAKSYKTRINRKRKTEKRNTKKSKTNKCNTTTRKTTKCKTKRKMQNRLYKGGATTIDYKGILSGSLIPLDGASSGLTKSGLNNSSRNVNKIIKEIKTLLNTDTSTEELKKKLIVVVQTLNDAYTKINEGIGYKQQSLDAAKKIQTDAQLSSSEMQPPIESVTSESPPSESPPSESPSSESPSSEPPSNNK